MELFGSKWFLFLFVDGEPYNGLSDIDTIKTL